MKILWLCNKAPMIVMKKIGDTSNSFGGWLDDISEKIVLDKHNELYVCFPYYETLRGNDENLYYSSFNQKSCNECLKKVMLEYKPDIIHIWGTEFEHTEIMVKICYELNKIEKVVINIQGIISIIGKYHYIDGLPLKTVYSYTLRDILRWDNINNQRKKFIARGKHEINSLSMTKNIIGRTDFDYAVTKKYSPDSNYYKCNESLRSAFYKHSWDINKIQRHSIFVSQCSYPIKGFHYLLEAMPDILKYYPDTHIYTTGLNLNDFSIIQKLKRNSYQKYLQKLIKKLNLKDHITFLGNLDENQMCQQYLKANVFVNPSTIENSPNSVGEAMLVGCPVIASDVGGVKNILNHNEEGYLYQSTAPYMLAYYVEKIFREDEVAIRLSRKGHIRANITHDRDENYKTLKEIYNSISNTVE